MLQNTELDYGFTSGLSLLSTAKWAVGSRHHEDCHARLSSATLTRCLIYTKQHSKTCATNYRGRFRIYIFRDCHCCQQPNRPFNQAIVRTATWDYSPLCQLGCLKHTNNAHPKICAINYPGNSVRPTSAWQDIYPAFSLNNLLHELKKGWVKKRIIYSSFQSLARRKCIITHILHTKIVCHML